MLSLFCAAFRHTLLFFPISFQFEPNLAIDLPSLGSFLLTLKFIKAKKVNKTCEIDNWTIKMLRNMLRLQVQTMHILAIATTITALMHRIYADVAFARQVVLKLECTSLGAYGVSREKEGFGMLQ